MSSYSYTVAETQTFSVTHARHMAAKVATDLRRMQRFYGYPSDADIEAYEEELVVFLKAGYLGRSLMVFRKIITGSSRPFDIPQATCLVQEQMTILEKSAQEKMYRVHPSTVL